MPSGDSDQPRVYGIRLTSDADSERTEIALWLAENAGGDDLAARWLIGLGDELATLAQHPKRYPVLPVETRRMGQETRRLLYPRSSDSSIAHHAYYLIREDGDDGPQVVKQFSLDE